MTRRLRLPGADELFRTTGAGSAAAAGEALIEPLRAVPSSEDTASGAAGAIEPVAAGMAGVRQRTGRRRSQQIGDRRPSGRERHEEKITVYVSAEELLELEQARLTLRGEHGMAVDRGRVVREALAVVLADLDAKGEASILVRRLRGR